MFVLARDFGFAPNPFHGICTLATCKPVLRRVASPGDWVIGMGGARLQATGHLVFAMRVSEVISYDEYWEDHRFRDKRPVRNGSQRMMVGDNIYCRDPGAGGWLQADSHHSRQDGTANEYNVRHDTQTNRVVISEYFFYFGRSAPKVPPEILAELEYKNGRGHRKYSNVEAAPLIGWLHAYHGKQRNILMDDPFDFDDSAVRYSAQDDTLS